MKSISIVDFLSTLVESHSSLVQTIATFDNSSPLQNNHPVALAH